MRAALVCVLCLVLACAASAATEPVNDPALVAAAKREGLVVFYSTFSQTDTNALAARFQAHYGFPMQTLRADPVTMAARIATEQRAGHYEADVTTEPGFQTDQLKRLGALERFNAPENRDLLSGTYDPDGYWSTIFINSEVIGFNTERLKALGLKRPVSWQDLAAPGWRGNFTLYNGSYEWLAALKRFYGRDRALDLARSYAANQPHFVQSHSQGVSMVVSGEAAGTANAYAYDLLLQRDHGLPIDFINPVPTILELGCVELLKSPPHPNAARLMERWWLSRDTQLWFRQALHRATARKDIQNDPRLLDPKVRYLISNPAEGAAAAETVREFREIFNLPG
ncbi:MAG TPA: extracellular solute-binding protein [Vicinamibacterales bacterium]